MKSVYFLALLFTTSVSVAQSKKELQDSVQKLTTQVEQLKAENQKLAAPKKVTLDNETKTVSYSMGIILATNIKNQGADSVDVEALQAGLGDVFLNQQPQVDPQEAMNHIQTYFTKITAAKSEAMRKEGTDFLEANKKNPDVKQTASGLQYKVLTPGKGKTPGPNDKVTVHYTGKLLNGTVFDSSVESGQPATFGVTQVIKGWTEALQLMKEGDKWMLFIPENLAYGESGAGGVIPPYSTLIFEVELIKVN